MKSFRERERIHFANPLLQPLLEFSVESIHLVFALMRTASLSLSLCNTPGRKNERRLITVSAWRDCFHL